MGRLIEQRLNASERERDGTVRCGDCGHPARFKGYRAKTFRTSLGPLTLERAYYRCAACDRDWHPGDAVPIDLRSSSMDGHFRMELV